MKVGIITFHFASNQGAALQCYALQTYLTSLGHEVQIINYRPPYHLVRYAAWKNPFLVADGNWRKNKKMNFAKRSYSAVRGFFRGVKKNLRPNGQERNRNRIFLQFCEMYLNQTRVYRSLKQLQADPPVMDAYVSGSDQVWNPEFLNHELDGAYFLEFGPAGAKRITYAVSPMEHFSEELLAELKPLVQKLDGVCIREHNEELEALADGQMTVAVDPSLLLDAEAYGAAERERLCPEPYLFVYGMEYSEQVDKAAQIISKALNLKVINGSPNKTRLTVPCEQVYEYGPREFLSYVHHAEFVVTNSFHGTAFSLIYQKPFVVVQHSTRGRRMNELTEKLGIPDRIWRDASCDWRREIPYGEVREKLLGQRKIAEDYFRKHLK